MEQSGLGLQYIFVKDGCGFHAMASFLHCGEKRVSQVLCYTSFPLTPLPFLGFPFSVYYFVNMKWLVFSLGNFILWGQSVRQMKKKRQCY